MQLFSYKVEIFPKKSASFSSSPRLLWTYNPALRGYSVEKFLQVNGCKVISTESIVTIEKYQVPQI